jgi:hypothetical protein
MTYESIVGNIVSDILFCLILVILGWVIFVITQRNKLLKFFGVYEHRRIVAYLSNLRIIRRGAIGIDGRRYSYQGAASAFLEMRVANQFRDMFNYLLPSLSERPGILSKLLISDVQVQLIHSPLCESELEPSSSFLILGSSAYNIASKFAEEKLHSQARLRLGKAYLQSDPGVPTAPTAMDSDPLGQFAPSSPASAAGTATIDWLINAETGSASTINLGESSPNATAREISSAILVKDVLDITDETYGFVERIVDYNQNRFVFYIAGISELATAGSAHFLITNWGYLQRKYPKDTPFLIVLRFETHDYKRGSIVFER